MTIRKIMLAGAAVALMSTPAWGHPGNGNGNGDHGQGPSGAPGQHDKGKGRPEHPGNSHRCVEHSVGYVASGTLIKETLTKDEGANTYSGTLEVEVTRANRHAAADMGKKTYEVSKVHITFGLADVNKDGSVGLDDVVPGDRVKLIGRVTERKAGCQGEFTSKTTIRRIAFHASLPASSKA
jgi:hypothetical protein